MGIAQSQPILDLLTYERYVTEGYVEGSYEIVEGVRLTMPGPSWEHQDIVGAIYIILRNYASINRKGKAILAPFDVLIRRTPRLQVRQPDVFYISNKQLQQPGAGLHTSVLEGVPDLVVEVISDSETEIHLKAKLRDYCEIRVPECWIIRPDRRTVELLRLSGANYEIEASGGVESTLHSLSCSGLEIRVREIFVE